MNLPDKPEAVAHVSDALWEAAIKKACNGYRVTMYADSMRSMLIDYACCLILLNKVAEPVDPLRQLWREYKSDATHNASDQKAFIDGRLDHEKDIASFAKVVGDYIKGLKP